MTQREWTAVDNYISDSLIASDPALEAALEASAAAGLPDIHVSPAQGKLLQLLAQIQGARTILEIGTLAAYSTIWLARALPEGGRLITLEAEPRHANVARSNLERAGLTGVVELRLGEALETLPQLAAEEHGPFDLFFIDADKKNNPAYVRWALKLSRPGSLIIVDNVVRAGAVANASSRDASVQGARQVFDLLATESSVSATAIQTVGSKGYDGFMLARVTAVPAAT